MGIPAKRLATLGEVDGRVELDVALEVESALLASFELIDEEGEAATVEGSIRIVESKAPVL